MSTVTTESPWFYRRWYTDRLQLPNGSYKSGGLYGVTDYDTYVVPATNARTLKTIRNANPDWRVKIAKHLDASSLYFRSGGSDRPVWLSFEADELYRGAKTGAKLSLSSRFHASSPGSMPSTDTALSDIALARLKRKMQKHQGSYSALAPTAELREMRSLIKSFTGLSWGFLKQTSIITKLAYDGTRVSRRTAWKGHFADAWLTYSFGIRPLVQDIKAVNEAISAYLTRTDHSAVLTGTAERYWWQVINSTFSVGPVTISEKSSWHHKLSYRYVAGLRFLVESCNNYGIDDHFNISYVALAPALWELKAMSWVVDYLTTIGPYLDDTFSSDASQTQYVCLNRRYRSQQYPNVFIKSWDTSAWSVTSQKLIQPTVEYWEFERTPLLSLPTLALRFRTQDEMAKHALSKVLNLAAVLVPRVRQISSLGNRRAKSVALLQSYS